MYLRKYLVALSDHWTFRNSDSWFGTYLSVTPNLYLLLLSHFFPYFSWISLRKPFKGVRKWSLGSGGGSSHSKDGSTSPDSESLQCTPLAQIAWIPFPLINILSDSSVLSLPGCSVDSGRISSQQRYSERRKSAKHLASAGLKCHFIPCLMRFRTVRYRQKGSLQLGVWKMGWKEGIVLICIPFLLLCSWQLENRESSPHTINISDTPQVLLLPSRVLLTSATHPPGRHHFHSSQLE